MRAPLPWSKREQAFLRKHKHLPRKDLLAAFQAKFGRFDVMRWNLQDQLRRMEFGGGIRTKRTWRAEEIAFIEAHHHLRRPVIHRKLIAAFGSTELTAPDIRGICRRRGWLSAYDHNNAPVGHEFVRRGRVFIRIPRADPSQPLHRNYAMKHKVLWEEMHGPIPEDHLVLPLNEDWFDFDPLNWLLVPRGVSSRLYRLGFFEAPPELKPTILAMAKLKYAIAHRGMQCSPSGSTYPGRREK